MNSKALILIDVDNTLLDQEYNFVVGVSMLKKQIDILKNEGFYIGLNSDSALTTLQELSVLLGLNGPIIAEKGSVISFEGVKLYTNFFTKNMKKIRKEFTDFVFDKEIATGEVTVCFGNVNALYKMIKNKTASNADSDTLLLINGGRESSFSFYCLQKEGGVWRIGSNKLVEFADLALEIAKKYYRDDELNIDINKDYGIFILHHKDTKKLEAISHIKKLIISEKIFMIGDSMSDFHDLSVIHCAVGNASEQFKLKSAYVSPGNITEGVIDILKWILP